MGLFDHLPDEGCRAELEETYRATRKRARDLRETVLARELATADEVAEHWPVEVPDALEAMGRDDLLALAARLEVDLPTGYVKKAALVDLLGHERPSLAQWRFCLDNMVRLFSRAERLPVDREKAEEMLLAVQRSEPAVVRVMDGVRLAVHPKGADALLWFRERDFVVGWIADRAALIKGAMLDGTLEEAELPDPVGALERAARETSHQLAVLCYAATTPGPRVDRERVERPPALYTDLHPIDQRRILNAFREVNFGRLAHLQALVRRPRKDGSRDHSWNVFFSTSALRLRVALRDLMHDQDLANVLTTMALGTPDMEDALEGSRARRRK